MEAKQFCKVIDDVNYIEFESDKQTDEIRLECPEHVVLAGKAKRLITEIQSVSIAKRIENNSKSVIASVDIDKVFTGYDENGQERPKQDSFTINAARLCQQVKKWNPRLYADTLERIHDKDDEIIFKGKTAVEEQELVHIVAPVVHKAKLELYVVPLAQESATWEDGQERYAKGTQNAYVINALIITDTELHRLKDVDEFLLNKNGEPTSHLRLYNEYKQAANAAMEKAEKAMAAAMPETI